MLGKTHTAVGIAAALCIVQPHTIPEIVIGTVAASVGAVISDIDVDSSRSHKKIGAACSVAMGIAVLVAGADLIFHLGILSKLKQNTGAFRMILGLLVFAGICIYGKRQPHRTFMHSILALALLSTALQTAIPMAAPYFSAAFVSHILLDLLNKKKVCLLYPLKEGFCLKLCASNGITNQVLGWLGTCVAVVEIVWFVL
ncbi:MAG: metal-dependent hydrolase [Lachnospiraceae bacterium]